MSASAPAIHPGATPAAASRRVRLLHVIATLLPGGTEMASLRLLQHLDPARYDRRVAWLRDEGVLAPDFEAAGIAVVPIGARRRFDPGALARLVRYVRSEGIDIVHTQMDVADYYGTCAGRLGGARAIVTTKQNADEFRTRRTWKRLPFLLLERLAYEAADVTIVVSRGLADFLVGAEHLPRRRMRVIPNGVDPAIAGRAPSREAARASLGLREWSPVIGTVGRLAIQKGHVDLLRAFPAIRRRHPRCGLVIAGDGPLREDLQEEARRLSIADRVAFLGHRRDVPEVLAALDLFVLPSLWEGLPLALLEAMAMTRPVVATRAVGVEDIVRDGETGLLVDPRDSEGLAAAVLKLLDDPVLADRLAGAGRREAVETCSWDACAARVDELYRDLLRGRS